MTRTPVGPQGAPAQIFDDTQLELDEEWSVEPFFVTLFE